MRLTRRAAVLGLSTPLVVLGCDSGDPSDMSAMSADDEAPSEVSGADSDTDDSGRGNADDAPVAQGSSAETNSDDEPSQAEPPDGDVAPSATSPSSTEANDDETSGPGADPTTSPDDAVTDDALMEDAVTDDGSSSDQDPSQPDTDAPAECGDGVVAGGLICFGTPSSMTLPDDDDVPVDVEIGQWEGTPGLDLVVANSADLVYFVNNGSGAFSDAIPTLALRGAQNYPPGAVALTLGHFDEDDALDVAVAQPSKTKPMVAFGVGNGGIDASAEPPFGEGTPSNFFVADIEGSGPSDDLLIVSGTDLMLVVNSGQHGEGFVGASYEFHGNLASDGAIAKLGDKQWVVYGGETNVYRAEIDYVPEDNTLLIGMPMPTPVGGVPNQMTLADFDEDGFDDVAVNILDSRHVSVLLADGLGDGDFALGSGEEAYSTLRVGETADDATQTDIESGDFNADGHLDLAVSVQGRDAIAIFVGDGTGAFAAPEWVSTGAGSGPRRVAVGDLNGDGVDDLAAVGATSSQVIVILSDP